MKTLWRLEASKDTPKDPYINLISEGSLGHAVENERPFTLLYLASPNGASGKDYAVFVYPPIYLDSDDKSFQSNADGNSNPSQRLIKLKGMFISLSQVVNDITGQLPIISKVDVYCKESGSTYGARQITTNDRSFNVAFLQEFDSNMVFCLPADDFTESETISLAMTLGRVFRYLYNSLDAAFKNPENHNEIEYFLEILAQRIMRTDENFDICFHIDMIQKLILEDDLLLTVDETLNEYESMDWLSDDCIDKDGLISSTCDLVILGSALFYKKYLISSHLPARYLSDIVSYVKLRGITDLIHEQPSKLVIWREVYPRSQSSDPSAVDFKENPGTRFHLMIVAVEHTLLCTLIEIPFICEDPQSSPNSVLIDQTIRFIITSLNEAGLIEEISQHLVLQTHLSRTQFNQSSWKDSKIKDPVILKELSKISDSLSCEEDCSDESSSEPASFTSSNTSRPTTCSQKSHYLHPLSHVRSHKTHSSLGSSTSSLDKSYTSSYLSDIDSERSGSSSPLNQVPFYTQDFRFRLSEQLIYYLDLDSQSRIFFSPISANEKHLPKQSSLYKQIKNWCIHISDQLNRYSPEMTEFGTYFICNQDLVPHNEKSPHFWIVGRKECTDREIFLVFRFTSKSGKANLNGNTESIFQRLTLHDR